MKLSIMQPYFLPYLGYFALIKHTDRFVLLDDVQFIRHGWIERNRILKPGGGWQYVRVPLKRHSRDTLIKDVRIDNTTDWKNKILAQLIHYKNKAPFYKQTTELLHHVFLNDYLDITTLNKTAMYSLCEYLGIIRDIDIFTNMALEIERPNDPGDWALNICRSLENVSEYINPIGGATLFDRNKYINNGIKLKFLSINIRKYNQKCKAFEPGLSIIDSLMWNSPDEVNNMLDDVKISGVF